MVVVFVVVSKRSLRAFGRSARAVRAAFIRSVRMVTTVQEIVIDFRNVLRVCIADCAVYVARLSSVLWYVIQRLLCPVFVSLNERPHTQADTKCRKICAMRKKRWRNSI